MSRIRSIKRLGPNETLPIVPRETFNTVIDLRELLAGKRFDRKTQPSLPERDTAYVLVRNDSGHDVDRFGILGIKEPIVLPSDNELEFKSNWALACDTPSTGSSEYPAGHFGRFVITIEPIADGKVGKAYIGGVCPVKLDVASGDDAPTHAEIIDGDRTMLQGGSSGTATVLWSGAGPSGEVWGLVRFGAGGSAMDRLKLTGNRTCGGSYAILTTVTAAAPFDANQSTYSSDDIATNGPVAGTFVNLNEQGTDEHSLTSSPATVKFVYGVRAGFDSDGRPKWEGLAVDAVVCDEEVIDDGGP